MQKKIDFDSFRPAQLSGEPVTEWDLEAEYPEDSSRKTYEEEMGKAGEKGAADLPPWGPPAGETELPPWGPPAQIPGWTENPQWAGRYCHIRFIHAAVGWPQVDIYVNQTQVISAVQYAELTEYFTARAGRAVITIRQTDDGQVLNQTSFLVEKGGFYTVAAVNSAAGIALYLMEDIACSKSVYNSCLRVANLTNQAPALDITMNEGRTLFTNVKFLDVTEYKQISPGTYDFGIAESGGCQTLPPIQPRRALQLIPVVIGETCRQNVLVTAQRTIERDRVYTMYLIGNAYSQPYLNAVLAESYFEY